MTGRLSRRMSSGCGLYDSSIRMKRSTIPAVMLTSPNGRFCVLQSVNLYECTQHIIQQITYESHKPLVSVLTNSPFACKATMAVLSVTDLISPR